MDPAKLKAGFKRLESQGFGEHRLKTDPIQFPRRYANNPLDAEVVGFIAASFAYGRVDLVGRFLERLFSVMGSSPYLYLLYFDSTSAARDFNGLGYRFNTDRDVVALLYLLHRALKKYHSLEQLFLKYYSPDREMREVLSGFVTAFYAEDLSQFYGDSPLPQGLVHLVPYPSGGGACKRLNLFLRWMVRKDQGDLGIWKKVRARDLVVPLDTHVVRLSQKIGLTRRKVVDWKMAQEITNNLKQLDKRDPLRFDFLLCHWGMTGNCPTHSTPETCGKCPLLKGCSTGRSFFP